MDQNGNLGLSISPGNGRLSLESGTTPAQGIFWGTDTNLYRSASDTLKTDDDLVVGGALKPNLIILENAGELTISAGSITVDVHKIYIVYCAIL